MPARGCGDTRTRGGLYLCVSLGSYGEGKPVEEFLVDPPLQWTAGLFRGVMMRENTQKINDVIMFVGKSHYSYVSDFIQEVKRLGISKRLPRGFDMSKLTPGKSRLFLVHPRAIPDFPYEIPAPEPCPGHRDDNHNCVIDLWALSGAGESSEKHEIHDDGSQIQINTPSTNYTVPRAEVDQETQQDYHAGIFAAFFITHFDYMGLSVPEDINSRRGSWNVEAVQE